MNNSSYYRVVALDLDGTLLDDEKQILPENITVLSKAIELGVNVILVTGRHHTAVRPFYQAINPGTPVICCNGAYLYDFSTQKIISGDPLLYQQVSYLLSLANQYEMTELVIYTDQAIIYESLSANINKTQIWVSLLPEHLQPTLIKVDDLPMAIRSAQSLWKVIITHDDTEKLISFGQLLERELRISCEWLSENTLEIVQYGNSKGNRLEEWLINNHLTLAQTIAIGDNRNDISMLARAGLSIAMGNSDKVVRNSAKMVIGNNNEPCIAQIINDYIINDKSQQEGFKHPVNRN